jgi:hypothetical protein
MIIFNEKGSERERFFGQKIQGQKKSKKFLTFTDLCGNISTEGQRKSKSKADLTVKKDVIIK